MRNHSPPFPGKRRAPCWSSGISLLRLSPLPLVRAPQFGASTERRETSQAARRRAAGSLSPAYLLPQLRWIGEEEEVVFHHTCAKPLRYCTCGTCCHAVFVNIKFIVKLCEIVETLRSQADRLHRPHSDERSALLRSSYKGCDRCTFH